MTVMEICFIDTVNPSHSCTHSHQTWRERFIVLRANRTLECYKSKKSADSNKNPRRVIDLRECINLEVGLEYKRFNFVFCLGTFKRTFFFAAQSDPLMLQWANVLEKTKNAEEGTYMCVCIHKYKVVKLN